MPTVTIHSKFELSGELTMKLTAVFTGKHELSISQSRAAAQNYRFQVRVGCEIAVLKSPVEIFCTHFIFDFCVRYTSRQTDTATCPLPHLPIPGQIKVSNSVFFLLYFTWGKRFCRQRTQPSMYEHVRSIFYLVVILYSVDTVSKLDVCFSTLSLDDLWERHYLV